MYIVGTSNVAWQTWPDQLHNFLAGLGYTVPGGTYRLARRLHPSKAPVCDDAAEFQHLETPRIGKVGWASWGFAYESKDDCRPANYGGGIGQHGFRSIAGYAVSCVNSWACNTRGQTKRTLMRPSLVAKEARHAHAVFLSNWINDSKQKWSQFKCYKGVHIDFLETTRITLENLRILVRAIHARNPQAIVFVMALYPDADGQRVLTRTLDRVAAINAAVKQGLNEPNAVFVDYTFPADQDVFQTKSPGHANCRGDRVMATRALEMLFEAKVLARGLQLPTGGGSEACLESTACGSLSKACCQRAALCRLDAAGACVGYGPGMQ